MREVASNYSVDYQNGFDWAIEFKDDHPLTEFTEVAEDCSLEADNPAEFLRGALDAFGESE